MEITAILAAIQAAIAAAPSVVKVVKGGVDMIRGLFEAGLISKADQDAQFARVGAVCSAALKGELGPEFKVEADPS